ncbi:MAG: LacI family DNA-binding transcriptional regulator [Bacteroidota bacterium]
MPQVKTTIYDIAKELQLTPSTVSRALRDHPRISRKTKKAVKEMAQQMNYQQNNVAAALRSGKTNILGVVVPRLNRSFFSSIVRGVEEVASQAGYNVMITQSNDKSANEQSNIAALMQAQVDGILASVAMDNQNFQHYQQIIDNQIPLVLFDRVTDISNASTVVIDDYLGAYKAVEHLIQQGYRRIAHFAGVQTLQIYKNRLRGYRDALEDNGLTFDDTLVVQSHLKLEDGTASMRQLLQLDELPDALFAASDFAAIGAMQVLKENGFVIPEDMALVGFMDEPFTSFVEPGLTTVNQLSEEMGRFAAKIFLEQVNGKGDFVARKTVLTPRLVIRGSSVKKEDD